LLKLSFTKLITILCLFLIEKEQTIIFMPLGSVDYVNGGEEDKRWWLDIRKLGKMNQ
jgi:hypothetical protein